MLLFGVRIKLGGQKIYNKDEICTYTQYYQLL